MIDPLFEAFEVGGRRVVLEILDDPPWIQQGETSCPLAFYECLAVDVGRRYARKAAIMFAPGSRARWSEYCAVFGLYLQWWAEDPVRAHAECVR